MNNTVNILFFTLKFVHYCVCAGLISVVLLQAGKSGGMAGVFGSGGSDQIFNAPSGVAFIKKLTIVMACIFLFTSLMLTKLSTNIGMMSVVKQLSNVPVSVPVKPVGNK
ncbi:preprotein translocase subunit SecG [Candidatus Endomicrobiellum cubanum]|jgi:preprotein translocase subunit SecG|uniref:preprotein translocase subunit SecG n=1 Tax=Candidatus Endomicrobiellum cubanum TaxID=3242325 RepID=UPI003593EE48